MGAKMICPKCGNVDYDGAFCEYCGTRMVPEAANPQQTAPGHTEQKTAHAVYDERQYNEPRYAEQKTAHAGYDERQYNEPRYAEQKTAQAGDNNKKSGGGKALLFTILGVIVALLIALVVIIIVGRNMNPGGVTHVIDDAKVFSGKEETKLEEQINSIEKTDGLEIFIISTKELDGLSTKEYGDKNLERLIKGDGYLIVIDMKNNKVYKASSEKVSNCIDEGTVNEALTTAAKSYSSDDYYNGTVLLMNVIETSYNAGLAAGKADIKSGDTASGYVKTEETETASQETTEEVSAASTEITTEVTTEAVTEAAKTEEGIHTYELIIKDCTWTEAYNECLSKGGHLVRINNVDEYNAIINQITKEGKNEMVFWVGGTRNQDTHAYHWIYEDGSLGEETLNTDDKYRPLWFDNEPSFEDTSVNANECYMSLLYVERFGRWGFNDAPNDVISYVSHYSGKTGYICEYE